MRTAGLVLGLTLLATFVGCSAALNNEALNEQPYRVVLMVSDLEGAPIGGASVWIDNELMTAKTAASFTPLGGGFPSEWQGWPQNFTSPTLEITIDFEGDEDHVEIIVAKLGYRLSRVGFDLGDVAGTFFFRAAVPLEPGS